MVDYDNDGLGESADVTARVLGMAAMQVLEAAVRAHRERVQEAERVSAESAREAQTQYKAQAALARAELAPVMGDRFWKDEKDLDVVRDKYMRARAFAGVDEAFVPYRERIEERVAALHGGLSGDELLEGPVPPGPRSMTDEQAQQFMAEVAPDWYKKWAARELQAVDRRGLRDLEVPAERSELEDLQELNATIRADFEHWRDRGVLSEHAAGVQEAWRSGEARSWRDKKVDAEAPFQMLNDEQRKEYGWRPGGPKLDGPLSVDDARLLAATTAPGWYRVQDLVAGDLPPALREKTEARLVEDMTHLRDSGRLDTPSAQAEWARFSGHELSVAEQDPNESLSDWQTRRAVKFREHWAATQADREHIAEPGGHHVGKPMSVPEAEEFAEKYAPAWLQDRHAALLVEAAKNEDPDRAAFESTGLREQFRFAMEEARDTGALSHSYVAGLRDQAAFLGVDESESMSHVSPAERVRFGGPAARPMNDAEAKEVMDGWAPSWYQDHVRRSTREGTMLSESARRSVLDSVRSDMTVLRDRGVLATDHAQRVWASSQPGFDPSDADSRRAMDRREQLWVETSGSRPGPERMDQNNRERFGGRAAEPSSPSAAETQPIPVVPAAAEAAPRKEVHEMYYEEAPQEARQEPQKEQMGRYEDWPVREPGSGAGDLSAPQEPPAKRRPSKAWDTPARRNKEAAAARAAGHTPEAVDGMTAADYGRSKKPVERGSGKPANFDAMVEAEIARNRRPDVGLER